MPQFKKGDGPYHRIAASAATAAMTYFLGGMVAPMSISDVDRAREIYESHRAEANDKFTSIYTRDLERAKPDSLQEQDTRFTGTLNLCVTRQAKKVPIEWVLKDGVVRIAERKMPVDVFGLRECFVSESTKGAYDHHQLMETMKPVFYGLFYGSAGAAALATAFLFGTGLAGLRRNGKDVGGPTLSLGPTSAAGGPV